MVKNSFFTLPSLAWSGQINCLSLKFIWFQEWRQVLPVMEYFNLNPNSLVRYALRSPGLGAFLRFVFFSVLCSIENSTLSPLSTEWWRRLRVPDILTEWEEEEGHSTLCWMRIFPGFFFAPSSERSSLLPSVPVSCFTVVGDTSEVADAKHFVS